MGVVLGLLAAGLLLLRTLDGEGAGPPAEGALLSDPFPAPALALYDVDGRLVRLQDFRGDVVALFFGYTHCPDVCPVTLNRLGRVQEALEPRAGEPRLRLVFVTVDPERDTPERLRAFTSALPGEVTALTGDREEVRAQAFAFGVGVAEREVEFLPDGAYLVDHTARTFFVGPEGRIVATLEPMAAPDEVEAVVRAVLRRAR